MASIDVSEVLDSAEFLDPFQIIKRAYDVNQSGETVLVESAQVGVFGILQAAGGKDIERLPEAFRSHEAIRIYYKGDLSSDEQGTYSDIVIWSGSRWQVKIVDDWDNWGQGYVKAICVMEKPNFGE